MVTVSIVECIDYEQEKVNNAVKKALDEINANELIKKGMNVLIKVNCLKIQKPEDAVTTNPAVVKAVLEYLKDKEVEVIIGDSSGLGDAEKTFQALEICGMVEIAKQYNAKISNFDKSKTVKVNSSKKNFTIPISKTAEFADLVINIPKLKTHALVGYTGAVKNLFGFVPGRMKNTIHRLTPKENEFSEILVDIHEFIKPQINLMDAVVGMEGNGPSNGEKKFMGLVIASDNAFALDIIASRMMGFNPEDISTNKIAIRKLLINPGEIKVIGEEKRVEFKKPTTIIKRFAFLRDYINKYIYEKTKPQVNKERCVKCGECMKSCPANAITMNEFPEIDKEKCIECFCCQEICPNNAIKLERKLKYPFLKKIYKKGMDFAFKKKNYK